MTGLLDLPTELFNLVAENLDSPGEIRAIRLVSRQLFNQAQLPFARLFKTTQTDLSASSLPMLEWLSQDDLLSRNVKTLRVGWVYKDLDNPRTPYGAGYHWPRHEDGCLDMTQPIPSILQDWLCTRFVNCRSFEITDDNLSLAYPDVDATTFSIAPTDALAILFSIISETGLPIRSLVVSFLKTKMEPAPYLFPATLYTSVPFEHSWSKHLRELTLAWDLELEGCSTLTFHLISTATCLESLTLHLAGESKASTVLLRRLTETEALPQLKSLAVRYLYEISGPLLTAFIIRFASSLQSLELGLVGIVDGSWADLINNFHSNLAGLEHIMLLNCRENIQFGLAAHRFNFVQRYLHGDPIDERGLFYSGTRIGLKSALKRLQGGMI